MEQHWRRAASEIVEEVNADVDRFRGATPLTDDQTVMVIKVNS